MRSSADKRERDRRYNAKRPHQSLYRTVEWRAKAKAQLEAEPWCRFHAKLGQQVKATIADHIERHGGDPFKFWSGRLQSLCKPCHDSVKQSMERGNTAGCDVNGMPTDPSHPWAS